MADVPRRERTEPSPPGALHGPAEDLIVTRRRLVAATMKRGGATYQQIVDTATYPDGTRCYPVGGSRALAFKDVQRGLKELTRELALEVGELREQESARLDDYLLRLRPAIQAGDTKAINTAIRITEVRARLYGLNEPERHEVITIDALDAAARDLANEIARRAAVDARPGQPAEGPARAES